MSRYQRFILALFASLITAVTVFPPWVFEVPEIKVGELTYPSRYRFAGYAPIYDPPEMRDLATYPAAQPKPNEVEAKDSTTLDGSFSSVDSAIRRHNAFVARHARDDVRTSNIDLIRLSVQIAGIVVFGSALFALGFSRPVKVQQLSPPCKNGGEIAG